MPETEDNIETETQSMNTEVRHDNSIVPMEIQDSQPSQSNGQAANHEVIDLENDTGSHVYFCWSVGCFKTIFINCDI